MDEPIKLGELIKKLEAMPQDANVYFDFGRLVPHGVDSYRGYYDHLAIGFGDGSPTKVATLLKELKAAVGKTFQGYKGGDFRMSEDTPVWVANYGRTSDTTVAEVKHLGWCVVLFTTLIED